MSWILNLLVSKYHVKLISIEKRVLSDPERIKECQRQHGLKYVTGSKLHSGISIIKIMESLDARGSMNFCFDFNCSVETALMMDIVIKHWYPIMFTA